MSISKKWSSNIEIQLLIEIIAEWLGDASVMVWYAWVPICNRPMGDQWWFGDVYVAADRRLSHLFCLIGRAASWARFWVFFGLIFIVRFGLFRPLIWVFWDVLTFVPKCLSDPQNGVLEAFLTMSHEHLIIVFFSQPSSLSQPSYIAVDNANLCLKKVIFTIVFQKR